MSHHLEGLTKLKSHGTFRRDVTEDRRLLCASLLHSSDVSNPAMPWHLSRAWCVRCAIEFKTQVAKELELGLPPTTFMDVADEVGLAKLNLGFIDFVVSPSARKVSHSDILIELNMRKRKKSANVRQKVEIWPGN